MRPHLGEQPVVTALADRRHQRQVEHSAVPVLEIVEDGLTLPAQIALEHLINGDLDAEFLAAPR